ncbi:MAG: hypothetical protein JNM12_12620 [Alphaproteobacteria bacterium]|nr:hypothetical protein [Alphaproteobacteria bacterium]
MNIVNIAPDQSQTVMTHEELLILTAALNEICNGIDIFEFQTRIGSDRERVVRLLKEMGSLLEKMSVAKV